MKKVIMLVLVLSLLVGVIACKSAAKETSAAGTDYATGFTVEKLTGGVVKVTDGEKQALLLVPAGKKPPADAGNLPQINIPVKRAVIMSSTYGAMMRPLGVLDSLVGSGTVPDQLFLEEIKQRHASGQITYVGGGAMGAPDYEAVSALKPDIVFVSTGYPQAVEFYNKLKDMGLKVVVVNDYLETDALGRLEWIKFIGAFYGKEREAENYFKSVEKKINDIAGKVRPATSKPGVLWGSIFMGTVYVSGGDSYVAKWIEQTGGNYLFKDMKGTGSNNISLEELFARGKDAAIFIYSSTPPYVNSVNDILTNGPVLKDLPVVKSGKIYAFQPWFYQIADKPDEIVLDLAYLFHPDLFPGHTVKHFMVLPEK
jgi:iron complex transport system substrate-binding protein